MNENVDDVMKKLKKMVTVESLNLLKSFFFMNFNDVFVTKEKFPRIFVFVVVVVRKNKKNKMAKDEKENSARTHARTHARAHLESSLK